MLLLLRDGDYEVDILDKFFVIDQRTYRDILAVLKKKNLIEFFDNNSSVRITDDGIVYLLNEVKNLKYHGEGIIARMPEIRNENQSNNISIPSFWKHGEKKLIAISKELYENHLLESEPELIYMFNSEGEKKCNWLGNHTNLLYLLWLLLSRSTKHIPPFVINIAFERFLVKGVAKNIKEVQSIASKVKPFLIKNEDELRGGYLTIYTIFEKSIL